LEIVPPLKSGGRPLVVGQVHRLLSREGETRWPKGQRNALLLVALSYQLARRLLEDLALTPQPLAPRRWRWKLCPGSERIRAGEIVWSGLGSAKARPLPRTQSFLAELPEGMVLEALAWAPPVVQPADRDGASCVVANYVSALLARQRLADRMVQVRRLQHATSLQRPLPEICQGIVHVLEPVYEQHRRRITELAPNEVLAHLLTGCSRAQYFRLKEGRDG
jgi:hypothetical protein